MGERMCIALNRPAALVCVSDGVGGEMREHYPALATRVLTIYNGIDTAHFKPGARQDDARAMRERLGIAPGRLVAAFVGSEWERKGLEPLIRALALVGGWHLVVAGGGDQRRYQELADALGVGEAVHWLGVSSDMQLVYALADAFALPTSYETFSLVTFEAAACGLPILATGVNGVRELIVDQHNGFLIGREPSEIAERLGQLAADPALRRRLGDAARHSALEFDSQKMVAGHHELYLRLAGALPR
jgi:UDP-glucose:(heptosyl)LPS alpha-1,3-glucosyltransferase